jgi:hypothetical protein
MSAARETTDFAAAIDRIRELADASADAMVTEGTVSPDHALLDLCADIGKQRQIETEASRAAYPDRFATPERQSGQSKIASGRSARPSTAAWPTCSGPHRN